MARVFSLLLAAFLAACGPDSPPPPAQSSNGAYGSPPRIVSGPFLAYLSPGPASTVLPYRRQDWPGPGSGLDQDAGTLPSGAVVNAFSTAPFEVTFRPPGDGGDIYAVRADGPAVALKTKDGGVPKDIFFCGDNWILWGADVGPDWHSVTANIYQARGGFLSAAETHWPSLHPIHRSHYQRAVHWFADRHPGDRHHRPRALRRGLDCAGEKPRAHVFRQGYRALSLGVLGSRGYAAPAACVPGARLLGAARPRLGHDRLPNVDEPRSKHDQVLAGGLWLGLPLMPTITYGAFGVPGCLDPLNYKSRISRL